MLFIDSGLLYTGFSGLTAVQCFLSIIDLFCVTLHVHNQRLTKTKHYKQSIKSQDKIQNSWI